MDNTQGLETTDPDNIAKADTPLPQFLNRHERRRLDAQYRKLYGKQAFKDARAEYKQAMAIAKGEAKE
jgi:hypothetical protein